MCVIKQSVFGLMCYWCWRPRLHLTRLGATQSGKLWESSRTRSKGAFDCVYSRLYRRTAASHCCHPKRIVTPFFLLKKLVKTAGRLDEYLGLKVIHQFELLMCMCTEECKRNKVRMNHTESVLVR